MSIYSLMMIVMMKTISVGSKIERASDLIRKTILEDDRSFLPTFTQKNLIYLVLFLFSDYFI